jgi:hypothetical protein
MEGNTSPEQENQPSPQELNSQLNQMIERLPQMSVGEENSVDDESFGEMMAKRGNSEYGEKLKVRVREFVNRANITEQFKNFIVDQFDVLAKVGVDPNNQELLDEVLFFLDRSHSGSGGIFDTNRARQLERVALARKVMETQSAQDGLARIHAKFNRGPEQAREVYKPEWEALETWKTEFRQNYGENL